MIVAYLNTPTTIPVVVLNSSKTSSISKRTTPRFFFLVFKTSAKFKPVFNFSKENSRKLIEINKNEVDERTIRLYDWNEMKHFAITDVKKSIFTYPMFDESMEYDEYNKTNYIPPFGFEFLDSSVELKPLGIAVVTVRTGRKKRNSRDMRFVTENVKRVEEIFLYNFEEECWFVAKKNNEDYLRRLEITAYIEFVYRSYLPQFFKSIDSLRKIEFFDSTTKNGDVLERLFTTQRQLENVFKNSLFVLLFYNEINEKLYEFYNLELDNLIKRFKLCSEYLERYPEDGFFVFTKVLDIEQKEEFKKLNDYVSDTGTLIKQILGTVSLKRLNEAFLKNKSDLSIHQKSDFEDMVRRGFYLEPIRTTLTNMELVKVEADVMIHFV